MKIIKNQNNNYEFQKLKDILKINLGQSPSSESYVSSDLGLPFYQGVAEFGNKYPTPKIYTNATKKNANKDEILMTVRAPVGRINIAKEKCSIGRGLCSLSSENNLYIYYSLNEYKNKWKLFVQGSIFEAVNKKDIENFKIPYAPKEEQEKIVKLLSEKEQHIENIKVLISKLEKRNEYYAEKLLSGELRVRENEKGEMEFYENTEWKEVKLNGKLQKIPKEWLIENIGGKLIKLINSGIDKFEGEKRYFATGEVGFLNELKKETEKITFENRTSRANMQPIKNSIWFAKMKNTNKNIYFDYEPVDIVLSTGFCGVTYTENINGIYLMESLLNKNFVNYKNNLCYGSTQEAINNKSLKKIGFLIPLKSEQDMIANILIKRRKEKEVLENLLEKETKEFEWLSEKLLSGEYIIEDK